MKGEFSLCCMIGELLYDELEPSFVESCKGIEVTRLSGTLLCRLLSKFVILSVAS